MDPSQCRVAVVGAGPMGICMLKNLLEEGFNATMYDSRTEIGGLWAFSDDPKTYSTLKSTRLIISKLKNCYADFPYPKGVDMFIKGQDFLRYMQDYANHFGLLKHFVGGKRIGGLRRIDAAGKQRWGIEILDVSSGEMSEEVFDKVAVTVGRQHDAYMPNIPSMERFGDRVIHSQAFKDPESFRDKDVLILGFAATTADITDTLMGVAKSIHIAHRRGTLVFPRILDGKPLDQRANRRVGGIVALLEHWLPAWTSRFIGKQALKMSDSAWDLDPSWRFRPAADRLTQQVMVSDTFVPALQEGRIHSVANIASITSDRSVLLEDGTTLHVDNIICCTGLRPDDSLMEDHVDFISSSCSSSSSASSSPSTEGNFSRLPRLYQNVLPPRYADSLAFLDQWQVPTGICDVADQLATAVTQVFLGAYSLPSRVKMDRAIDEHHDWLRAVGMLPAEARSARVTVREVKWRAWLNEAAGNGMNEYLGWGWRGLWFWLTNWRLCELIMTGVDTSHIQRLFPGRRKQWDGAQLAIENVNAEYADWNKGRAEKTD